MKEPKGKISVVMPTGKRMEVLNNLSEAIKANSEATIALAKIIEKLPSPQVSISGCNIQAVGNTTGIHIASEETNTEQGVYHYSPTGYSKYDYGYPGSKKLEPGDKIPKCYGEEEDEPCCDAYDDEEDETEEDEETKR